ncbi:two-component sensor histidine kinase, partial [Micromonospora globispora]
MIGPRPAPASPRRRFAGTLTSRAVLVTCAVALVSVLVTALVAVPLAVRGAERRDQVALAAQARLAADVLRIRSVRQRDTAGDRLIRQLRQQDIDVYLIHGGTVDRPGLPRQVVTRVAAGRRRPGRRLVDGERA